MKETWNVLDPDEYVKHNPFMGYTNMKIEKISPECSEISMKITHGVTNLMGMVHGGMLYALADVVTGLTARADGRKYVTQSAHINFYPECIGRNGLCERHPDPPRQVDHHRPQRSDG